MPVELEKELIKKAKEKWLSEKAAARYVYWTLNKIKSQQKKK